MTLCHLSTFLYVTMCLSFNSLQSSFYRSTNWILVKFLCSKCWAQDPQHIFPPFLSCFPEISCSSFYLVIKPSVHSFLLCLSGSSGMHIQVFSHSPTLCVLPGASGIPESLSMFSGQWQPQLGVKGMAFFFFNPQRLQTDFLDLGKDRACLSRHCMLKIHKRVEMEPSEALAWLY